MITQHAIEHNIRSIDDTFSKIQDNVLDEYNTGTISEKEMRNILMWCEKMKNLFIKKTKDLNPEK